MKMVVKLSANTLSWSQEFAAGETRSLPLQFIVDPDLPDYVDTITLQYTFFDTASVASNN